MTNKTIKAVSEKAQAMKNDLVAVKKELKRIQSVKCRLRKQKGRSDYAEAMAKVLAEENLLAEVRNMLEAKPKTVPSFEQADVDKLDYDETIKALKSIQSKKTLSRWLTTVECDNDEYRNAVRVEKMLLEHKAKNAPVAETQVRKSDVQMIIDTIEQTGQMNQEQVLNLLKQII